jgi:putative SOS response-associated peptidase YedK
MCNLYRLVVPAAEVARMCGVELEQQSNAGGEVYPGYPGLVLADGKLATMVWGFPLQLRGKNGHLLKPKPINNTRDDKLDSPFWRASFFSRRCLIPMQAFAEAEGDKGVKTRTWIGLPDTDVFTCAGVWRDSAEWGRSYSLMMTDASEPLNTVHDRMPVIIDAADRERWLGATPDEARTLCKPYAKPLRIDRTGQAWSG